MGKPARHQPLPLIEPQKQIEYLEMVPLARLERAHLSILDFESSASTNSTTGARRAVSSRADPSMQEVG
jgi:hypothetical protein